MGQIANVVTEALVLSDVDRLIAANAGAGVSPSSQHLVLLGEDAGNNLSRSNIIAIGYETMSGGGAGISTSSADGSVVIGENTARTVTTFSGQDVNSGNNINGPLIAVGGNIFPLENRIASSVVIGYNISPVSTNADVYNAGSVLIGQRIFLTATATRGNNVIIGYEACVGTASTFVQTSVVIGERAWRTATTGQQNVVIGVLAGQGMTSGFQNVMLGSETGQSLTSGSRNIFIGYQAGTDSGADSYNTVVGQESQSRGDYNVIIGALCSNITATTSGGNVLIGPGIDASQLPASTSDHLLIQARRASNTRRTLIYGHFTEGSLVLGDSSAAQRDLIAIGCTNAVKLLNGTRGTGNVGSGGFFYVSAGTLRWVDQNGVETYITPSVAGQMAASVVGYGDGAAAAAGTLNNAPAAGNPTKWIPVDDAGTVRYIPAW